MSAVPGLRKDEFAQMLQEFYRPSSPAWDMGETKQILSENALMKDKHAGHAVGRNPRPTKRSMEVMEKGTHTSMDAASFPSTSPTREMITQKERGRFASWLSEQERSQSGQRMTRDSEEVPVEPLTARGGARSSSQGTGNSMTESKLDEPTKQKAAIQGETIASQRPRQ